MGRPPAAGEEVLRRESQSGGRQQAAARRQEFQGLNPLLVQDTAELGQKHPFAAPGKQYQK